METHNSVQNMYLKLSRVRSIVISLNKSSLKEAKTFKSFTRISTALLRSSLICYNWKKRKKKKEQTQFKNEQESKMLWWVYKDHNIYIYIFFNYKFLRITNLLIQSLKVLLLSNFEKDLHGISVIIWTGEPGKIILNLIPVPAKHQLFEVLEVKEQSRFLL